jgi:hypothetical protein
MKISTILTTLAVAVTASETAERDGPAVVSFPIYERYVSPEEVSSVRKRSSSGSNAQADIISNTAIQGVS